MKQNYEFKEFLVEDFYNLIYDGSVILPRFQRDLVWSEKQVEELALSLKMGIPFGTFLLAGNNPFKLLDGLQRAHAIMKIYQKPQKFFNEDQISESLIDEIKKLLESCSPSIHKSNDDVRHAIVEWVQAQVNTDPTNEFKGLHLARHLFQIFFIREVDADVLIKGDKVLSPLISDITTEINNIGKIKIPCIIYKGTDDHLPTIFEKLNTTGTKLSRFQVFAANWVDKFVPHVQDKRIKKAIYTEYSERQKEGNITIEHFLENENEFYNQDLNLYEYLLGLGKILEVDYQDLFGNKGDSIGFTLTAACLQGSIRKIISISDVFNEEFIFQGFQDALFDAVKIVFSELEPYISLRINKSDNVKKPKPIIFHSDYQIISFVSKVFRDKYDLLTFSIKDDWNTIKKWVKQIPYYYLYDQLEDNWRGSGDKRIEEMLTSDRYRQPISLEKWEILLNKWFKEKELNKKQNKRTSIDNDDILFLNFIYTHLFTFHDVHGSKIFHLEHLVPIKLISDYLKKTNNTIVGLPISAVSNLCYLESEINKKKGKKTIYKFVKENPQDVNILNIEEKCTFTSESDLAFVDLLTGNNDEGWEKFYEDFLTKRFDVLKEKFYSLNGINSM